MAKRDYTERNLISWLVRCKNVRLIEPTGYVDFVKLLGNAKKVITDSGGIQKEAYLLLIPCITIRKNTEWIETLDSGWNLITDTNSRKIVEGCRSWQPIKPARRIFGNGKTSRKIKQLIESYISKRSS